MEYLHHIRVGPHRASRADAASSPQPDRVERDHLGGARPRSRLALQRPHTAPALTPYTPALLTTAAAVAAALALGMHGGKAKQRRLETKAIACREEVGLRAPGCT